MDACGEFNEQFNIFVFGYNGATLMQARINIGAIAKIISYPSSQSSVLLIFLIRLGDKLFRLNLPVKYIQNMLAP